MLIKLESLYIEDIKRGNTAGICDVDAAMTTILNSEIETYKLKNEHL
jgi:hypothetical protein